MNVCVAGVSWNSETAIPYHLVEVLPSKERVISTIHQTAACNYCLTHIHTKLCGGEIFVGHIIVNIGSTCGHY